MKQSALPWRYGMFLLALVSAVPATLVFGLARGLMIGFDLAALAFLLSLIPLFAHDTARIRAHVRANDANRTLILAISAIVSLVILTVVGVLLGGSHALDRCSVILVLLTLGLTWIFSNAVYTLHYAYLFYTGHPHAAAGNGDRGGLNFPDTKEPDYRDFAYFAFTLGMTFQTSDVTISARPIRRVALAHSLAAFVFNLGIIAYTINMLGG